VISLVRTARLRWLEKQVAELEALKAQHTIVTKRLTRRSVETGALRFMMERYRKIADELCELRAAEIEAAEDGGPPEDEDKPTNYGGMP
jgi:hypothetical protein